MMSVGYLCFVKDTDATEIYTYGHTLAPHAALPIYGGGRPNSAPRSPVTPRQPRSARSPSGTARSAAARGRCPRTTPRAGWHRPAPRAASPASTALRAPRDHPSCPPLHRLAKRIPARFLVPNLIYHGAPRTHPYLLPP